MNGRHFVESLRRLELHRYHCSTSNEGYMELISTRCANMEWVLEFACPHCKKKITIDSQPKQKESQKELSLTEKTVWGFCAIGSGHENMEEVLTAMEVKSISPRTFRRTEAKLGKVCKCSNITLTCALGWSKK